MATRTRTEAKTAAKTTIKGAPAVSAKLAAAAKSAAPKVAATKLEAKAKAKATATAKATAKAKPAGVTAAIIEGIAARIAQGSKFYATALAYHARQGTTFPRTRNNATRTGLTGDDVATVFAHHDKRILSSGNGRAQAMFDVYMMKAG